MKMVALQILVSALIACHRACVHLTDYMLIWRFLSGDHTFQVHPQESERLFLRFPVDDVEVEVVVVDENVL